MRKKNFLWTIAAALAFVSCSQDELLENPTVQEQNAIAFDTYVGDNAQGRAVVVDDDYLKLKGFVVDAYYTGLEDFSSEVSYEGNAVFMNSTKVTYDDVKGWTYSPVKYWPNNEGDKVSFFAYAPYGSSQISYNDDYNHSKLNFEVASEAKNQVDLIYHQANGESGYEKTIDMEKPTINKKIKFNFLHALSRIAFDVKAVVDDTNPNSDNLLDGNTRINIKQVALVNTAATAEDLAGSFYTSGTLNMLDGTWDTENAGEQLYSLTGDDFYRAVEENYEKVAQLTKFNPSQQLNDEDSYLMIIPQDFSEDKYKIYIEYDVISEEVDNNGQDTNDINDGNTITNQIFSVDLDTNFESGKAYKFTLLLGMTSVKVDAEVADWEDNEEEEVWLPNNDDEDEDEGDGEGDGEDEGELPDNIAGIAYDAETHTFSIGTADDLDTLAKKVNDSETYEVNGSTYYWNQANYIQTADIDLSTVCGEDIGSWTPIGLWVEHNDKSKTFEGSYNGQGYTVKNLYVNDSEKEYVGLFGYSYDGSFSNIHIESGSIVGNADHCYVGGIVGSINEEATITSCSNNAVVSATGYWGVAGGITGSSYGQIIACHNMASITGGTVVGGISGYSNHSSATIYACYNIGAITANIYAGTAGGVVGSCNSTIVSCYNTGTVEGNTMGGIAGELEYDYYENNYIQACYYGSPCTTANTIGSFVGSTEKPNLSDYTDVPESATADWDEALTKMNAQLTEETGNWGWHYEMEDETIRLVSGNYTE